MDVMSALSGRGSIRKYLDQPVEEEKLNKVLEAARLSPSAGNKQNWKFIIVKDSKLRSILAESTEVYQFIGQAPIIIVACGTDAEGIMKCGQYRHSVDVSIATAYMILEAYEQGLGTCWIGRFDEEMIKDALGIPDSVRVVALTPLGYGTENPHVKQRKKIEEIVCYDTYK